MAAADRSRSLHVAQVARQVERADAIGSVSTELRNF